MTNYKFPNTNYKSVEEIKEQAVIVTQSHIAIAKKYGFDV